MRKCAPGVFGKENWMDFLMISSHRISCGRHFGLFGVSLTGNMITQHHPLALHVPYYLFIFATTFLGERFESASFFEVAYFSRRGDEGDFVFFG